MVRLLSLPKQLHFLWARSANNPPQLVCRLPEVQIKTNPFATYTKNNPMSILPKNICISVIKVVVAKSINIIIQYFIKAIAMVVYKVNISAG